MKIRLSMLGLALGSLAMLFVLGACAKVADEPEYHFVGAGLGSLAATDRPVVIPTSADVQTVDFLQSSTITKGNYGLIAFAAYVDDQDLKARSYTRRQLIQQTVLNQNDLVDFRADWSQYTGKDVGRIGVELNIPVFFTANGPGISFGNRKYYWNEVASDNTFQFRSFGNDSPAGLQLSDIFLSPLTQAPVAPLLPSIAPTKSYSKANVLTNQNQTIATQMTGTAIAKYVQSADNFIYVTLYFEIKNQDAKGLHRTTLIELNYRKM